MKALTVYYAHLNSTTTEVPFEGLSEEEKVNTVADAARKALEMGRTVRMFGQKYLKDPHFTEGLVKNTLGDLHATPDGAKVCSINNKYYTGATIYIRSVNIERDGEKYGTYYQAVRSYREKGKVRQKVVHLGEHQTAEAALESWPTEIQELERKGRPKQAEKLQQKLDRLRELT